MSSRTPVLTGQDGRFSFSQVQPGRYSLAVQAIGFAPEDLTIVVAADTTVLVALDPAPLQLDTLAVRTRDVTVRGEVREAESDVWLMGAEVFATPDLTTKTDPIGRFKLSRVPSGIPLTVRVQSFGYLPLAVTIVPQRDTTLQVVLSYDPVVQRMIAQQLERIDDRSEGRRYAPLPVLDRDELLKDLNNPLGTMLQRRLGQRMHGRIACTIIDENPIMASWRFESLLPDEVQRIEITVLPGPTRPLMVRIYTREFIQDMVRGKGELVRKDLALGRMGAQCR